MNYIIPVFFGIAPSVIWLLFYLKKDKHPESNFMVLKIFFYGILITPPVFLAEAGISGFIQNDLTGINIHSVFLLFLYWFFGIALVEELFKYLVIKYKVLNHSEFDEPVDAMLYMIIAALGFAALENILALISSSQTLTQAITISFLRFVGATMLHALCSGLIGYFLAMSFFETKKQSRFIILGIAIAIVLHGFFNISIIGIEASLAQNQSQIIISNFSLFGSSLFLMAAILGGLSIFVSLGFKKVKSMASVCKSK